MGPTRRGKGTKVRLPTDGEALPLAVGIEAANHAEVNLMKPRVDSAFTPDVPRRLIDDRAADSDPLRERLARRGIGLICPHRKGRVRPETQDGRRRRRRRRRWKVERAIAWLHAFKRLVVRNEFYAHLYHGYLKRSCLIILFRRIKNWL